MGQANQRGSFEQRKAQGIARQQREELARQERMREREERRRVEQAERNRAEAERRANLTDEERDQEDASKKPQRVGVLGALASTIALGAGHSYGGVGVIDTWPREPD